MTKDVLVSLSGLQYELSEDDALEVVMPAVYHKQNGKHYIRYEEFLEENGKPTNVLLKLSDQKVEVLKKGDANVHMLFEEGKQNSTVYQMPFGTLLMGIHTMKLNIEESDSEISAEVVYGLDINYAHVSDCQIKIRVSARE
ncbi:MAG: DUF1934 domain-containing protein [Lachnospiraceae bacterium]|jgi:uncharacterized beta-barrel protein YwiB (DUF1934 family)|nr:DUF1934 domain-containing protein [Lachnospiraceae bacterium]MCX4315734.1 DUF1934 domain-containing protein [Lachnospiraceae bacterium]